MSDVRRTIRTVFYTGLRSAIYTKLKNMDPFQNWGIPALLELSESLVNENKDKIDAFLDENNYRLTDSNIAIQHIIDHIIIPAIRDMRI